MRKYFYINSLLVLIVLLNSCDNIFIPDPIDPRLPKYTEDGNNVAGAIINENIWRSEVTGFFSDIADSPEIISNESGDSLFIQFYGTKSNEPASVMFLITGQNVHELADLTKLNDKKFELGTTGYSGFYTENYDLPNKEISENGQIYIKQAKIENRSSGDPYIILSGTFGFTTESSNIFYGRFDYRISHGTNFMMWKFISDRIGLYNNLPDSNY